MNEDEFEQAWATLRRRPVDPDLPDVWIDPIWNWDEDPHTWTNRYDFIRYKYRPDWVCPGEGKCHGCVKWCDHCGDVRDVCDATWPLCCDTHERYPDPPPHFEPNPNQLVLPGVV